MFQINRRSVKRIVKDVDSQKKAPEIIAVDEND